MGEFRSIITVGKARGVRLRQARQHTQVLRDKFASVKGWPADEVIPDTEFWLSTRETLDKLVQCFHEASAFNTVMDEHVLIDDVEYNLTEAGAKAIAERKKEDTSSPIPPRVDAIIQKALQAKPVHRRK